MFFGDVATAPAERGKGHMRRLVENVLSELQSNEKVDIIMNPYTGSGIYKGMYSKFGFSATKRMHMMVGYQRRLARSADYRPRRNKLTDRLRRLQNALLSSANLLTLARPERTCGFIELADLPDSDLDRLNRLYVKRFSESGDLYLRRDRRLWEFFLREKSIHVVREGNDIVAYSVTKPLNKSYIVEEIIADDWHRFVGILMAHKQLAEANGFQTVEVYADRWHLQLIKHRFYPIGLIRWNPFKPRCILVFRLLKNFVSKMEISDCSLVIRDEFLKWEMTLGRGVPRIECSQKMLADLLADGTVGGFLHKAHCSPRSRLAEAKRAVENIKRKYQIPVGLRCFVDRY